MDTSALLNTATNICSRPTIWIRRPQRVFGQIMTHSVDYADLYFQYSRSEAWSLEEGR